MSRERYERTEKLIRELTDRPIDKEELRLIAVLYLSKSANGEEVPETYKTALLQYLALSLEGRAPSLRMNKAKRRNYFAGIWFMLKRGMGAGTMEAAELAAVEFGVSVEAIRKEAESKEIVDKAIKLSARESFKAPGQQ